MNSAYQNSAFGTSNLANYLQEKTLSAGPLELVAMLYAKSITELQEARRQLAAGNIALRSKAISKVCDLIVELDAALNMEAGGELALRLRGLYRYSLTRLLDANVHQADEPLAEVLGLMSTLSEGWQIIAKGSSSADRPTSRMECVPPVQWDADGASSGQSHSWTL
jgi:flagellar protein FliS